MTVAAAAQPTSSATMFSPRWIAEHLSKWPLHIVVIGLTAAWMVPTIGLLVSSFRPFSGQATSGWWTAFSNPTTFTISNYTQVLSQGTTNLGQAFFNSFMIAVPATVLPSTPTFRTKAIAARASHLPGPGEQHEGAPAS